MFIQMPVFIVVVGNRNNGANIKHNKKSLTTVYVLQFAISYKYSFVIKSLGFKNTVRLYFRNKQTPNSAQLW